MLKMMSSKLNRIGPDIGFLILRVVFAGAMIPHGYQKLSNFPTLVNEFPNIMGGGSALNLSLAIFAEFFCSIAVVVGFYTRLTVIPLIVTMVVAGFIVHGADPWQKKELAFLYLGAFVTLFLSGGGKYSLKQV